MEQGDSILVAGGNTLIGAGLLRQLKRRHFERVAGGTEEPDYTVPEAVEALFACLRPKYVFVAAGRTGGIGLNQARPAELMMDNLLVTANLLGAAHRHGVRKLLYLGSSCSYPRDAPQPMRTESLMTGPLEPTNEPYAMAKLAGLSLCRAYRTQFGADFIVAMPANSFGPGDDFSPEGGHVVPALLRRFHEAKLRGLAQVTVWGSGRPQRDFVFVDDLAEGCIAAMEHHEGPAPINIGSGEGLSIADVAHACRDVVAYQGDLLFDASRPDGMPVKMLDGTAIRALGWHPTTPFRDALQVTYRWFLEYCAAGHHE